MGRTAARAVRWAHIGRLADGLSERALLAITGTHPENPTLNLSCREVLARRQKQIEVLVPLDAVAA